MKYDQIVDHWHIEETIQGTEWIIYVNNDRYNAVYAFVTLSKSRINDDRGYWYRKEQPSWVLLEESEVPCRLVEKMKTLCSTYK